MLSQVVAMRGESGYAGGMANEGEGEVGRRIEWRAGLGCWAAWREGSCKLLTAHSTREPGWFDAASLCRTAALYWWEAPELWEEAAVQAGRWARDAWEAEHAAPIAAAPPAPARAGWRGLWRRG